MSAVEERRVLVHPRRRRLIVAGFTSALWNFATSPGRILPLTALVVVPWLIWTIGPQTSQTKKGRRATRIRETAMSALSTVGTLPIYLPISVPFLSRSLRLPRHDVGDDSVVPDEQERGLRRG